MSRLITLLKFVLIAGGIVIFIIFRRFLLDNQKLIMGTLYTLGGVVFLLGLFLIYIQKKVETYISNNELEKAIDFAKKLKFYPNLSQSLILNILVNSLNKEEYDFFYSRVSELNWSKGMQWRYFVEIVYYSLLENTHGVESSFKLLQNCKITGNKPKYMDEIIKVCTIIRSDDCITNEYYIENIQESPIVGKNELMNTLLRKCLNLS